MTQPRAMLRLASVDRVAVTRMLARYGLTVRMVPRDSPIPGSYWGGVEAGLRGETLFASLATPLHSILHEAAHFVCMTPERRVGLDRDAGGDDAEECAVCYLQAAMADALPGVGRERLFDDMDAWGYSFRLGSAQRWYELDAQDARDWLQREGLLDARSALTWRLRGDCGDPAPR